MDRPVRRANDVVQYNLPRLWAGKSTSATLGLSLKFHYYSLSAAWHLFSVVSARNQCPHSAAADASVSTLMRINVEYVKQFDTKASG